MSHSDSETTLGSRSSESDVEVLEMAVDIDDAPALPDEEEKMEDGSRQRSLELMVL